MPSPLPPENPLPSLPPPQPPLDDDSAPPVVHGIDAIVDTQPDPDNASPPPSPTMEPDSPSSPHLLPVRPGDLAAFAQLFARFHIRVEKAAAGRKYRPLRDAFDSAAAQIAAHPDKVHMDNLSELVIDALRLGCESRKTAIVDACLDCIHRLFEYAHLGATSDATQIRLDARPPALDEVVAMVCACLEVKDEDVYLRMVQTLLTATTRTRTGLHQGTLLAAVRTIYNIYLNARTPGTRTTARVSLTQVLNLVFSRMEAETAGDITSLSSISSSQAVDVPKPAEEAESHFASVLQKDAYLLFRALCKLSAKEVADANAPDAVALRSKLLSLELIRNLITNSGPAFRSGERFIYALRHYLTPSLLVNCMLNSGDVMDISFDIFEILLRKDTLRPLLKTEISAMFDTVVFRFLESPTAGPLRKRRAITLLNRLSSDRQTMADLFLNYDCDLESPKIFERMCNVVSTAAQHKSPSESPVNGTQHTTAQPDVKRMALTSVTQIVRSLREWSKPIEHSKGLNKDTSSDSIPSESPSELTDEESIQKSESESSAKVSNGKMDADQSPEKTRNETPLPLNRSTSGSANVGVISEGNDRDTTRFEETLKAKRDTAHGITLFNTKPKRGIEYLVKNGRLKQEPLAVAEFLHKAENLDATMIGEYLGESGTFNLSVMHAYTDMHDFTDMTFDNALRLHLSGFRLPGEAQKIDRIMEKFASRYCECNPTIFANADAAYVLAYSTIMLHTDAHNDTIKNKMTKEEFIKNNRGINDGGDLDPVFLGNLYDRITTTEIRLTSTKKDSTGGDSKALNNASSTTDPAQRAKQFEEESERLMAQTKVLFAKNRRPAQDYTYYPATNVHLARLMFETAWYPVLAAISLNLEEAQPADTGTIALCLDCFRNGIAIASTFGIVTSKDAFVSSLAKFTHLHSIAEMRPKNVECIRMILAIAALEGNNLGDQWVLIVRAISQLEQVRAVASGNPGKFMLHKEPLKGVTNAPTGERNGTVNARKSMGAITIESSADQSASPQHVQTTKRNSSGRPSLSDGSLPAVGSVNQRIDPKAASMASTIAESEIERIFSNSSKLSSTGVSDLCAALCTVALDELGEKPAPRIFCMQKIVEIAYYNMDSRTRLEWGKIWEKMGQFFASSMCHPNRSVSMYAVDALRQLSSKFLAKDELSNFSFQRSFLKPFEACFAKSKVIQIREFVLTCVSQLVHARAHNIKSGWKSVFGVLALAADDKVDDIMKMGWELVDSITRKYIGSIDDVYVDAVMGITAYTRTTISTDVPIAAISLLSGHCAFSLAEGKALSSLRGKESMNSEKDGKVGEKGIWFTADTEAHIGSWFPILTGLAAALQDDRSQVRTAANAGLFKVLEEYGGQFSPDLWVLIFRGVISPVFDDVGYLSSSADRVEGAAIEQWATTTGLASMKALVDVFVQHVNVTRTLLQDLLDIIRRWILQETEFVAREGMFMLDRLITKVGSALNDEDWNLFVKHIHSLFVDTIPHEILGPDNGSSTAVELGTLEAKEVNGVLRNPSGKGDSQNKPNGRLYEEFIPDEDQDTGNTQDAIAVVDESEEVEPNRVRFKVVRAKCVVQLQLIKVAQKVVVCFYKHLPTERILDLGESLSLSYLFAHNFNANIDLRFRLWRTGFMNQVPNLLMQETQGLTACLRLLFWMYLDPERVEHKEETEEKVMSLCEGVLRNYINSCYESKRNAESEERREVTAFSPVISFIVLGMMQLSHDQFERQLPSLYSILLDLMDGADDNGVRTSVTNLFRARITPTPRRPGSSSSDSRSSHSLLVAHPQLPGEIRERVVRTTVGGEVGPNLRDEICKALQKVCGVESVVPISSDKSDTFTVMSAAPDEMLVAGAQGVSAVRAAFVEPPDRTLLD
ncbi:Brefeldin A-inhibited guanine nucleotide-exchange protein 1 [Gracilariopsis chorda]|uniref:Brefeldin A-inhibited guanine nucleotide-exchange protein 1 n=1 Tax=Gracilariopsis chorda TaxID=448386 RepID=A0A2V3IFG2_9FLOR|nr:Brefeldin A-inhibited guanine nucleotide-exchange protein 1 [Gracilariopsis chorda]|eukprot:PXF40791.1 Brefeldin A-inhibited guanine nucleotide-exchange protein 1 [Gracilariopsis chorda]